MREKECNNIESDLIFEKCKKICENCVNSCKKTPISNEKIGKFKICKNKFNNAEIEKKLTNRQQFDNCECAKMLFGFARKIGEASVSQFERVKLFHVVVAFLEENCDGVVSKEARRILEHEWMRVLLNTYDALPNLVHLIEGIIDDRAYARTLGLGLNVFKENTYSQVEQILKFLERKRNLIELYDLLKNAMGLLSEKSKQMAKIRFFEHKSAQVSALELGLGSRTVQRRTERLLDEMRALSHRFGFDANILLWKLGDKEPWMLNWFRL